ncbi:hypothetical protein E5676_scaffold121G001240 [Cucumis melo var. makuwa]|uniref:Uncharacterized protein n=1 Tax=Cucumis melo var. makuwa TaxID=1194695 RepID=A0A5A7TLI3_CUCMM|nr:hypothetical protein E6C27_scaffold266G00200 [Cucumis melo var. makuwa]TYK03503.1 hypothetical protein E5676_scaffold121G001240 [Cucumis melo var. makuwa]
MSRQGTRALHKQPSPLPSVAYRVSVSTSPPAVGRCLAVTIIARTLSLGKHGFAVGSTELISRCMLAYPIRVVPAWPACLGTSSGYATDQFVLDVPLGHQRLDFVPTGSYVAGRGRGKGKGKLASDQK